MFCRKCHYDLRRLESGRCPECGRPFDPQDPGSTISEVQPWRMRRWILLILLLAAPIAVAAAWWLAIVILSAVLGPV